MGPKVVATGMVIALGACHSRGAPPTVVASATNAPPPLDPAPDVMLGDFYASQFYGVGAPAAVRPLRGDRSVLFLRRSPEGKNSLWETDLVTKETRELLRPEAVVAGEEKLSFDERARLERQRIVSGGFTSYEASADGSVIVVGLSGRYFVFTRADGKTRELMTGAGAIDPQLSPDAKQLAYVRDKDVRVLPIAGGKELTLTRGGTELRPHGLSEMMAQEEFARMHGFWWSPDSQSILYQESDLSPVPVWTYADPAHPENPAQQVRYPRTGAPNAVVGLAIASVKEPGRPPRRITWDAKRFPYLVNVTWSDGAPPTLDVRSREDQHGAVLAIDPATGTTRGLVAEDDAAWLNFDTTVPRWLPDGQSFLWSTERNGAFELELRARDGKRLATISPPGGGYRAIAGLDAKQVFFTVSPDAVRNELWAAPLDGSAPAHRVASRDDGGVWARFGSAANVFVTEETSLGAKHEYLIRNGEGAILASIPSLARTPPFFPKPELRRLARTSAQIAIVRPRQFAPGRRYPVIDSIYGGPWYNVVRPDAYGYIEAQWLADTVDAIVVFIDGRGTSRRDRAWERAIHGHYGSVPLDEHVNALAELGQLYPELDVGRVGVYGWSNGGYLSALATLRRPDVFKVGVAGAPVTDLRDYDALMEFFEGPPGAQYDDDSVLTWAARPPTKEAPARPLLVMHGTADDNVYFLHSLKLANTMELAGRHAELVPIVDRTHMVGTPASMLASYRRIASFLREHL